MATPPNVRRRFIQLIGGGAIASAIPLAGGCSPTAPASVLQAWEAPAPNLDLREFMLAHALLAPNPHNRQPWLADLRRPNEITLVCDQDRLLPETDPFGRQIIIGCGAFIELAVIAAAERGVRVQVQAFPDGVPATNQLPGGHVIARLSLKADGAMVRDPLFAQIRRRHTNKGEYDATRKLATEQWAQVKAMAADHGLLSGDISDTAGMDKVRALTRASYENEMLTKRTWLESANLLRIGPDEVARHRDGITIMGTMPRLLTRLGLFDRFAIPVRDDSNFKRLMDRWTPFETASSYYWIASKTNERKAQLESGRAYVRTHLAATAAGIDMHPLSQAVQEFAEVREQHQGLHQLLGFDANGPTIQMLCRVGYGKAPATSTPRRDIKTMVQR